MKSKTKLIHELIFESVFKTETLFYICEDSDLVISHAKKRYNINLDIAEFDSFKGICLELACKGRSTLWLVWVKTGKDWKTMGHESAHLVFRILDSRGVKYNGGNNETWCYLHEYFITKFWHIMCKK